MKTTAKEVILVILSLLAFGGAVVSAFLLRPIITVELMALMAILLLLFSLAGRSARGEEQSSEDKQAERMIPVVNELEEPLEKALDEIAKLKKENDILRERTEAVAQADNIKRERDLLNDEVNRLKTQIEGYKTSAAAAKKESEFLKSQAKSTEVKPILFDAKQLEKREKFDLREAINEVVTQMNAYAAPAGIRIMFTSAPEPVNYVANRQLIITMLKNIVDNSIKYMLKAGNMVITLSDVGDDIFIICKDDGMGISAEELEHIFELNFQGSNRVSGNGLGLTQAKDIVTAYKGVIYARSAPSAGMGVYIQLPKDYM